MLRVCLDLNVWCGALLAQGLGRKDTAAGFLAHTVRGGASAQGPIALVISLGMLDRLRTVLARDLGFGEGDADRLCELIAAYGREGPSLTLGGVGVLPVSDEEDRHVLETAWSGQADVLVTHNLTDFLEAGAETLVDEQVYGLRRGAGRLLLCHTFAAAAWLRGESWPDPVRRFLDREVNR
ncbi:PIN domain-containing protein [Phenylobacterium sp.]|uniref:PIN domain-containing protein n=1 Tax=Phenylobacterium sp. TaxID=1871053 RepID=UPI0011FD1241|nr:PIN domain-containing protein [Phenylobacterium sp.]THD60938.1 MAG: PIN domain-containing protein [Phenylobacterium sp.]